MNIRRYTAAVSLCALLSAAVCFVGSVSLAAPIAFHFDAVISQVQGDPTGLNLPFPLFVGEQISGKYTFQSDQDLLDIFVNPELGNRRQLALTINGTEITAWTNIGVLNSNVSPPAPLVGPTSNIQLGYHSPNDVFPGWPGVISGNTTIWNHKLGLFGVEGTITSPQQLLDPSDWNQLSLLRRLDLQFGFPDTVTVQATVGDFSVVPEPASASLVYTALAAAAGSAFMARVQRVAYLSSKYRT